MKNKKSKKTSKKQLPTKGSIRFSDFKTIRSSFIGLVILFFILFVVFFLPHFLKVNSSITDSTGSTQIRQATSSSQVASASAKPTPKPILIPANSGRSVNVPIIYYHYIGKNPNPADKLRDNLSVDPELFDQQMAYISSSGFNPISLDTLYAALKGNATLPSKPIIITFDDGYVDFYVNAFPILRKYNIHATQFIPTGLIDTAYYLHWEQIKEMNATGLISFEAHSITHANLPTLSDQELKQQLSESKLKLSQEIGKPVNFMAYPYGTSNERVWEAVKAAGFMGACGTWGSSIESEGNIFDMPRIKIPGGMSLEEYKRRV